MARIGVLTGGIAHHPMQGKQRVQHTPPDGGRLSELVENRVRSLIPGVDLRTASFKVRRAGDRVVRVLEGMVQRSDRDERVRGEEDAHQGAQVGPDR